MRKLLLIFSVFFIISCNQERKNLQKPNFLIGNWIRTNDKPNQKTFEFWKADYSGLGFTLQENDTIFKEHLKIINKNDSLYLEVSGVNESPVLFVFTNQTDTSFVCENPKNEFPKKITYYLDNKQLKAAVSNDDFNIEFVFERNN